MLPLVEVVSLVAGATGLLHQLETPAVLTVVVAALEQAVEMRLVALALRGVFAFGNILD